MPCAMEHKPNPGTNCSPGWPVGRSGPSTLRPRPGCRAKVGAAAAPRVEAQWGACQRTVRGAVRCGRRAYLETVRHPVHLSRASMSAASRPPRPRALFVAALLLLTLALAGAIALQAYRNFLGHKATAERVLRDYSRLAAARFAQRTEMAVYYHAFWPARSEEHTSELQSHSDLVCRLL